MAVESINLSLQNRIKAAGIALCPLTLLLQLRFNLYWPPECLLMVV